jgi:hypothetical protein
MKAVEKQRMRFAETDRANAASRRRVLNSHADPVFSVAFSGEPAPVFRSCLRN